MFRAIALEMVDGNGNLNSLCGCFGLVIIIIISLFVGNQEMWAIEKMARVRGIYQERRPADAGSSQVDLLLKRSQGCS